MQDLKKFTILVVDDEELLRDAIAHNFKRKGFTVLSAENGTRAFELVKNHKIDLVLSDVRMPGGNGVTLLEQIHAHSPDMPIVLITGLADMTEKEFVSKGARKVLPKPFDKKELINAVYEALGIPSASEAA